MNPFNLSPPQQQKLIVLFTILLLPLSILFNIMVFVCPLLWPYLVWMYNDAKPEEGSRTNMRIRKLKWWKSYRDYFPIKLHQETPLNPQSNYLFVAEPHGILPFGLWCNFGTEANGVSTLFPGMKFYLCTLVSNFKLPFIRDLLLALGMVSGSQKSILYLLNDKQKGNVVILVVGGSEESLESQPGTSRLVLKKRHGFARLALQSGTPIVPVFTFGETDTYRQVPNPEGSTLRWVQEKFKSVAGVATPVFYGASLLVGRKGIMPIPRPINTVVGKPIPVQKVPHPTEEEIDQLRDLYINELHALYDRHKDEYAPNRKEEFRVVQ